MKEWTEIASAFYGKSMLSFPSLFRIGWSLLLALVFAALVPPTALLAADEDPGAQRKLTLEDLFAMEDIDATAISPDGEWLAVVVRRAAQPGEVFGRISYDLDPSRADILLISTRTGERRAITDGRSRAAGYWCPSWSPDGRRLAMLSTQPEGDETRGGDNVRLHVWDRESGELSRAADQAVMTQTRYGSPLHQLDLRGGGGGALPHSCHRMENAPFLWLDANRLLFAGLPEGRVSGLMDDSGGAFRLSARNADLLRDGSAPTVHAVGSGEARMPHDEQHYAAVLRVVDVAAGSNQVIASVPAYPFRGGLSVTVSPDRQTLALLPTLGAFQPQAGKTYPNSWSDGWTVERRLGFVDLGAGEAIRWVQLPPEARWPLQLYGWSPDSRHVAIRGRADPFSPEASGGSAIRAVLLCAL